MTNPVPTPSHPVILFDGLCNLCSGTVQFIIRRDPSHRYRFASLQGVFGQQVLAALQADSADPETLILLEEGKTYTMSTAALRVARHLKGLWPMLYGLIIIPRFLRDGVYRFIANRRYRWFGKKETCWMPSQDLSSLFIV